MFALVMRLALPPAERADLERLLRATSTPRGIARRARCIVLLADRASYAEVCAGLGVTDRVVARWKQRYQEGGVLALADAPRASPRVGVSASTVLRVWQRAGLQPHRLERYVVSTDPAFETKAADIIGLYLDPPQHAVVLSVDEKTAIQALDRLDPVLPLSPGRAERHGFEYYRHGTLSLYAALDVATGHVAGMPAERHRSVDFLRFMDRLVSDYGPTQELHVILDNLSAHKTTAVAAWLAAHPQVHFHFTPTYSSWLNQVELWFAKIERDLIARGIFTSVPDLRKQLLQYITLHNKTAHPFKWTYTNPKHRVRAIKNSDGRH